MRIRKGRIVSLITVILVLTIILSFISASSPSVVRAERVELEYSGGTVLPGLRISSSKILVLNKSIAALTGERIKTLEIVNVNDLSDRREIVEARNLSSYTFSESMLGSPQSVSSRNNTTDASYYAWYRFSVSSGDAAWHADFDVLDGSYSTYNNHRVCGYGIDPTYPSMKEYPGCSDSSLSLSGQRTNNFKLVDNNVVDPQYINHEDTSGVYILLEQEDIDGPSGITGFSDSEVFSNMVVDITPDFNTVIVRHTGNFNFPSPYAQDLAAPGAKLMVYFGQFAVDITSNTYQYPYVLEVTYEQLEKPDLAATNIVATTSLTINSNATFQISFQNGSKPISSPFTVYLYRNAEEWGRWTYSGALANQALTEVVTRLLTTAGNLNLTLVVDGDNEIEESREDNNTKTVPFTINTGEITGDFDIIPSTINYREPFQLTPKNITATAGCTYQSHIYRLSKGSTWDTAWQTNSTASYTFTYPSHYPAPISAGSVSVMMKLKGSCGESGWINKTLTVHAPASNNPPFFKIGWFHNGDFTSQTPLSQVVQGTTIQARVIEDPAFLPYPSPSDPDHDEFTFTGWDFSRSNTWISGLPATYGFVPEQQYLPNIHTDTLGYHLIYATMTDKFGAAYTASTIIEVIPPNPIAVASCPPVVKENRPVAANLFNSSQSISPLGRQIDHSRDEWTNKIASYTNGTTSDITVQASLHVWDNGSPALKSLQPSICNINVKPDLVPIGKLDVLPFGIRNMQVDLYNKSYSPDGDVLTSATYLYKYDAANDGFGNDGWTALAGTMTKASFTPTRVGKYQFDVTVCEDYGRCASATATQLITSLTFDTINLAPTVSFTISGENKQPDLSQPISYGINTVLNNWSLYKVNSTQPKTNKNSVWSNNGGLVGGLGKGFERQYFYNLNTTWFGNDFYENWAAPFQDNGYGANNLSPWRAQTSFNSSLNNLDSFPVFEGDTSKQGLYFYDTSRPPSLRSNKKYIYFDKIRQYYNYTYGRNEYEGKIFAMNKSEIGNVKSLGGYFTWDFTYNNGNPYDFVITAAAMGTRTFPSKYNYCDGGCTGNTTSIGTPVITGYEISDKTIYATIIWTYAAHSGYDSDGNWFAYEASAPDIATFDAYTGQYLGSAFSKGFTPPNSYSTYENGWKMLNAINRNDNMVFFDFGSRQAYELDRTAAIVRQIALPSAPAYTMGSDPDPWDGFTPYYTTRVSNIYKGMNGDIYYYEDTLPSYYPSGSSLSVQTHVTKLNNDSSLSWRVKLSGTGSNPNACANIRGFTNGADAKSLIFIDPINNKVVARSFTDGPSWTCYTYMQSVNMNSGAVSNEDPTLFEWTAYGEKFRLDWSGNYYDETSLGADLNHYTTTRENYYTRLNDPNDTPDCGCPFGDYVRDAAGTYRGKAGSGGQQGFGSNTTRAVFSQYFGDGIYVTMHHIVSMGNYSDDVFYMWISKGPPTTAAEVLNPFELGQFVSDVSVTDTELSFTMRMEDVADTGMSGFSFRMADPTNRYAVETDGTTLYLSRYVGGSRTVLSSVAFPFQNNLDYSFKVNMAGAQIDVSLNGVPYLSASDGSFLSGKIGPFSEKSYVKFNGLSTKVVQAGTTQWLSNYAIWEGGTASAEVRYDHIIFSDPESDPLAGSYQWSYTHTPKFMNNQGVSVMNGQTYSSERLSFDKVGEYWVTLRARDDPNPSYLYPSMVFDPYRKNSNAYQERLIIHRRPVAQFTIGVNGDGTISWSENSYDPDRWVHAGSYSSPDITGINYGTTRGIMERKYYYTAPSGAYAESKLTRPTETGTYTVGLSVRDEYGAWSNPYIQSVTVGSVPPPNVSPTATLTYPNGTQGSPNLIYTTRPSITWNQNDAGGTIFQGFHVKISNEAGQVVAESGESAQWTSALSASWSLPVDLQVGVNLQVQVRVSDGEQWSVWSNVGWMKVNSAPAVTLMYPNGLQSSPNLIQDNRRPTISWNQYDADLNLGTYFQGYHVQVLNDVGTILYDFSAGQYTQSNSQNMTVTADLPTGQPLQVRVRVHDGATWSGWSNTGWLIINLSPSAQVTNPTGTQATPSTVSPQPNITWTQSDPDPGTVFLKYQVQFWNEANTSTVRDSGEVSQNTSSTIQSYQVTTDLPAGQKLRVRVRVFDGFVWSNWSVDRWILTNRPPDPVFDWLPKPIWEGDMVTLLNESSDPDGNLLTYNWEIKEPDGAVIFATSMDVTRRFSMPGEYLVKLTVSDGTESRSVTHSIWAQELKITASVSHTPQWLELHTERGNNTTMVPMDFYSGEIFQLELTASSAPVAEVVAWIDALGRDGIGRTVSTRLIQVPLVSNQYQGELFESWFLSMTEGLELGLLPIHFRITYSNGAVKTQDVSVRIIGAASQVVRVHRQQ